MDVSEQLMSQEVSITVSRLYSQMALASCVMLTSCDIQLLANIHTRVLSVIAGGFSTVPLDRGASSFATALHIRERYAKFPNTSLYFGAVPGSP